MKITIESTALVIDGVGRLWNGVTENGVKCQVLVTGIASESDADRDALQPELATLIGEGEHQVASLKILRSNGGN